MKFRTSFPTCSLLVAALGLVACDSKIPQPKAKAETGSGGVKTVNHLATVTSPFLKRHESDPVDWYPWGEEAFKKAVAENKPVMVCIGYSSCPWTQKMQQESYRDEKVATYLNKHFVSILVDREDRPDLNNSYMRYTFLRTKKSGWPLHIWLTPKGLPIFNAVYLPPVGMDNLPSLTATLDHVSRIWNDDPPYVEREAALRMKEYDTQLRTLRVGDGRSLLDRPMLDLAYDKLTATYDPIHGGFGSSPKFHQAPTLQFLLEYASLKKAESFGRTERARSMVETSLLNIGTSALQDQIGGGFHRYCHDPAWTIPQFEKMLFDQGTMATTYLLAYQVSGNAAFADVARRTFNYVESELNHPEGGFYCAENSFSPSKVGDGLEKEGGYYVWKWADAKATAGDESFPVLVETFGLTETGNLPLEFLNIQRTRFPNENILRRVKPLEDVAKSLKLPLEKVTQLYAQGCEKLLASRKLRPRPLRDEKVLPAWNASMIAALIKGAAVLNEPAWLKRAEKATNLTLTKFLAEEYPRPKFAEDYATMIQTLLDFYETTGEAKWLTSATDLQARMDRELWDLTDGGYWDGPADPNLFVRSKSCDESAEFAPNATSASNLVRLGRITGDETYIKRAAGVFRAFAGESSANPYTAITPSGPATHIRVLSAYDQFSRPGWQFVFTGPASDPLLQELRQTLLQHYRPNSHILYLDGAASEAALTKSKSDIIDLKPAGGKPGLVIAKNFRAEKTITSAKELKAFLDEQY